MTTGAVTELRVPADLAFGHFEWDRDAHFRDEPERLAAAWNQPDAGVLLVIGENIVLSAGAPPGALFRPADIPAGVIRQEQAFLGQDGGAPRFALLLDPAGQEALAARDDLRLVGLRQIALERLLPPPLVSALACAKALLFWHSTHRFCSACGQLTEVSQGGWRRNCAACKAMHFPRTDPVVIMLAVRDGKCLLGRQSRFPPGMYSCLAGFCEPGETIEDAVRRELHEEAGIRTGRVRYLASQPWPFPESLMIGCIAEAMTEDIVPDETELEDARWFTRAEALDILDGRHGGTVSAPGRIAIARVLLKAWARQGAGF